jgi:surfeit locus 1 family protein
VARPALAVVGLVVLGAIFVWAGAWQWRRAAESRATLVQFAASASTAPLEVLPRRLEETERFRRVEVRGEYLSEPQFLLDNMLSEGAAGYHVLTPLRVAGVREHVLVNRGWVRADADREVLPNIGVEPGVRRVTGRVERLPRSGLRLGTAGAGPGPVLVVHFPTAEELAGHLGEPVFDYQLLLDPGAAEGFRRDWRAPGMAPDRHLAYAGQWWLFAAGVWAAAVVIVVKILRRKQ